MVVTIIDSLGDAHSIDFPGAQSVLDVVAEVAVRGTVSPKGTWLNPAQIVTITKAMVQDG